VKGSEQAAVKADHGGAPIGLGMETPNHGKSASVRSGVWIPLSFFLLRMEEGKCFASSPLPPAGEAKINSAFAPRSPDRKEELCF
jgi:hypothetical protein